MTAPRVVPDAPPDSELTKPAPISPEMVTSDPRIALNWRKEPGYKNMHVGIDASGKEVAVVQGGQGFWRYTLNGGGGWSLYFPTVPMAKCAVAEALAGAPE